VAAALLVELTEEVAAAVAATVGEGEAVVVEEEVDFESAAADGEERDEYK
jgi:hypothetical protein